MYQERESGPEHCQRNILHSPDFREMVVTNGFDYKVETQLIPAFEELGEIEAVDVCISTQSATDLSAIPSNSIDYIFTDPALRR